MLPEDVTGLQSVFLISYLWYPSIGMVICVVVGLLITMVTNCNDPSEIPSKYLIPVFDRVMCCLPDKNLRILRCNRPLPEEEEGTGKPMSNSLKIPMEELSVKDLHYVYDNVCLDHEDEYKKPAEDGMSCDSLPSYHSRDILGGEAAEEYDSKTITSEVTIEKVDIDSYETTRI